MCKRLFLILALALPVFAAEAPLTNDDVLAMSRAGLSAETIIAKIASSKTAFTTDTNALVALANAGVPDAVIRTMIGSVNDARPRPSTPPAAPVAHAKRKRIEDIAVATSAGGRCEHATLELSAAGIKTSGCHETDVNVTWSDVKSVCYLYSFRSTLVVDTTNGERRIHMTTPAELKAAREAIGSYAKEETNCR